MITDWVMMQLSSGTKTKFDAEGRHRNHRRWQSLANKSRQHQNENQNEEDNQNDDVSLNRGRSRVRRGRRSKRRHFGNRLSTQLEHSDSNANDNVDDAPVQTGRRSVSRVDYSQFFDDADDFNDDNDDSDFDAESDVSYDDEDSIPDDHERENEEKKLDYAWEIKDEIV